MKKLRIALAALLVLVLGEGFVIYRLIRLSGIEGMQSHITLPMYSFSDITYSGIVTESVEGKTIEGRRKMYEEFSQDEYSLDFGLVKAEGTWMSDTEMANDFNTVEIACWKEFNYCFTSQAELNDLFSGSPLLYLGTELYEIKKWGFDEIRATSGTGFGCFEYELIMDRINQTVTSMRKQTSTEGLCEGTSDKPLLIYLSDRFREMKRQEEK
jgi:hypothetical protein